MPPDAPAVLTIAFEPPGRLLNMNDREHWSKRAQLVALWRECGFYEIRQATGGIKLPLEGKQRFSVEFPVRGQRRRDPMNFVSGAKVLCDSATDVGLWADDDGAHVTVSEPTLTVGGTMVVITITPVMQ